MAKFKTVIALKSGTKFKTEIDENQQFSDVDFTDRRIHRYVVEKTGQAVAFAGDQIEYFLVDAKKVEKELDKEVVPE